VRPESEYRQALALIEAGINDCEVGRRLGIPRGTIRDWRVGVASGSGGRTKFWSGQRPSPTCFRCNEDWVDEEAYAYLLGQYLGDGCLSLMAKQVYRLRIVCDLRYPDIIDEIASTTVITRGVEQVGFIMRTGCVEVYSDRKHWPCLFPQHGPGLKHQRLIELAPWQQSIVSAHPKALIRGLIHSDGNRHVNPITRRLPSGTRHYRYTRYMFTNVSTDILGIFTDALDLLDVHWTRTTARDIAVSRREDVTFLDSFIGPKS
jgi:hypothetical protein